MHITARKAMEFLYDDHKRGNPFVRVDADGVPTLVQFIRDIPGTGMYIALFFDDRIIAFTPTPPIEANEVGQIESVAEAMWQHHVESTWINPKRDIVH